LPFACHTLAGVLVEQGGSANLATAERLYTQVCALPERASSCDNLGLLYARGAGAPPDRAKAALAFRRGCEQKFAPACTHLGQLMSGQ
jgi:TPR repeat protein